VAGSVLGAIVLTMLTNIMDLAGVSGFTQIILKGCVVLLAVTLSTLTAWRISGRLRIRMPWARVPMGAELVQERA
jgi:ribose/xylose/arabinose/galactoside ABC-type transport system permease subunit